MLALRGGCRYGQPGSGLVLDLVYNPVGASLPPPQAPLEVVYKVPLPASHWRGDVIMGVVHMDDVIMGVVHMDDVIMGEGPPPFLCRKSCGTTTRLSSAASTLSPTYL